MDSKILLETARRFAVAKLKSDEALVYLNGAEKSAWEEVYSGASYAQPVTYAEVLKAIERAKKAFDTYYELALITNSAYCDVLLQEAAAANEAGLYKEDNTTNENP